MYSINIILVLAHISILASSHLANAQALRPAVATDCNANGLFACPIPNDPATNRPIVPEPNTPPGLISATSGGQLSCDYYTCVYYPTQNKWVRRTFNCPRPPPPATASTLRVRFNTTTLRCDTLPACEAASGCTTPAMCVDIALPTAGMPTKGCLATEGQCYPSTRDCTPTVALPECMCKVAPQCQIGTQTGCLDIATCVNGMCPANPAPVMCWQTQGPLVQRNCIRDAAGPPLPTDVCACNA